MNACCAGVQSLMQLLSWAPRLTVMPANLANSADDGQQGDDADQSTEQETLEQDPF